MITRQRMKTLLLTATNAFAYGVVFCSTCRFFAWLVHFDPKSYDALTVPENSVKQTGGIGCIPCITCVVCKWIQESFENGLEISYVADFFIDVTLLALFLIQHSWMRQDLAFMSRLGRFLIYAGLMYPCYLICTAFCLELMISQWRPLGFKVWEIKGIEPFYFFFHYTAWAIITGSLVILDLREITGLKDISSTDTYPSARSPEFEDCIKKQRHVGLVPLTIVLLVFPVMSLSRLVMGLILILYMRISWANETDLSYSQKMKFLKKRRLSN